jgi:YD repeat-containing protein
LKIERSNEVGDDDPVVGPRPYEGSWLRIRGRDESLTYYSIGLFYAEIIRGIYALYQEMGASLFSGDPAKQVTQQYYYNGSGEVVVVTDLDSAIRAIQMIQEQGEASRQGTIYDAERKLCHYYRFQQLILGRYYVIDKNDPLNSDEPDNPTGESFTVDWDAVYPLLKNARLSDYPKDSELHANAVEFQQTYSLFLAELETSFNGQPETLIVAVHKMFRIRELATQLIRNPIPGRNDVHGAPIFRIDQS